MRSSAYKYRIEEIALSTASGYFPMMAVIDGYALVCGTELATARDFRLTTPSSMIGFIHSKLNIGTTFGGSTGLV